MGQKIAEIYTCMAQIYWYTLMSTLYNKDHRFVLFPQTAVRNADEKIYHYDF